MPRRNRKPSQTSSQPSKNVLTVGRYPTTGVPTFSRHVPRPLLPEVLPRLLPDTLRKLQPRVMQSALKKPVLRPVSPYSFRPVQKPDKPKLKDSRSFEVMPGLRLRRAPCDLRADRRRAVFAAGAAGKPWKKGGPRMYRSARSITSRYSCG